MSEDVGNVAACSSVQAEENEPKISPEEETRKIKKNDDVSSPPDKVELVLKAVGDTPIMSQKKWVLPSHR